MTTRSYIAIQDTNGTCRSSYCHWDGYPEHNGLILCESYKTRADVEKLINLGSLSKLDDTPETCFAYHRDRGDEYDPPAVHKNRQELIEYFKGSWAEYIYLYVLGTWLCYDCHADEPKFVPLDLTDLRSKRKAMLERWYQSRREN